MPLHSLNDTCQSAYRPEHSTETALVKMKNDIDTAIDRGEGVLLILLYLSVTFDTINHSIPIRRLESRLGFTGPALRWLETYLAGRTQIFSVNSTSSDPVDLQTGVPQGSVFGPSCSVFVCSQLATF